MQFRILGPLEVRTERGVVSLGGVKPRAVLAVLLLHANESVSGDQLALALWGQEAPAHAVKTVQVHVSRVRKALGDGDVIKTSPAGYCLRVRPGELDADRFAQLVDEGRGALAAGDAEHATMALRSALELWRGPPLADLADEAFAQAEITRLEEQRLAAVEARIAADLELGREAELIGELQRLAAANPTREHFAGQLMVALYRSGRQADALKAYRDARSRLVAEIGIEPGPDLRQLQDAILQHDQSLLVDRVAELPRELERAAALPIEGREAELAWLRERWQLVRAGTGALVTVRGENGIGKSRLAAEFAAEANARGATVLYADGGGPPAAALNVLTRVRETHRPTVLVIDDADRATASVRQELEALARTLLHVPVLALVLETAGNGGPDSDALVLSPLDGGAVHAIITQYVPDRGGDDPPEEWLLGASRGVPGLVHELARQWARREAARRVQALAERTAARRVDLRTMERELAVDVAVLEAAHEREPSDAGSGALVCPFKGLASFQVADAPYFFGRERLVAELVARLVGAPLLGIVGPSGSGKSSVMRAGLLPALAAGVLPGRDRCQQVLIRPGAHPLAELGAALARAPDEPMVLAVDQFEEIFTICDSEQERATFVADLARLAHESEGEGTVVLAMRADFYGRCAEYPELSRLLAANHVLVSRMSADELRRAVECPAHHAGLIVDPELVGSLVGDVAGEPGALPLLSTALLELWQHRDGRRLRHVAYERAGGVRGAVARLGEDAFARLDESQRAVARRVLLRLATIDDEGSVERRRVSNEDLRGEDVAPVVELLADGRLLTVDADTVELAHEALLREWPRLRGWIQEDQESLRVHRGLSAEAREWARLDRDDGALLRGARLAEAREWIDPDSVDLAEVDREFLSASLERARRDRKARRRRLELVFGALAAALVAIGIIALVAIDRRHEAERQRNLAISKSLALQSAQALDNDPELALRLALWADELAPTAKAAAALRQATLAFRQLAVLPADSLTDETAAYSPDGTRIVTGGDTGVARLWDVATRRPIAQLAPHRGTILSARYSQDGKQIALGFQHGTVMVTDARLRGGREALRVGADTAVNRVVFSRDGTRVAGALGDGTARVISLAGGAADVIIGKPSGAAVLGIDIDAEGRVATASSDGAVRLWNPDGTQSAQLRKPDDTAEHDVEYSPDGGRVLAVGEDGHARLWDASTDKAVTNINVGPRVLTASAFSPDGRRFATTGWDGAVRVWQTEGASLLFVMRGQRSRVFDVGFGRTADRVVSAGDDGTARIWNASGLTTFTGPSVTLSIDLSPSGRWVATGSRDGAVRLWDARRGPLLRSDPGPEGYTLTHFSPVADELAIGRESNASVLRWPLSAPQPQTVVRAGPGSARVAARFDPTGTRIVYMRQDRADSLHIRELRTGRELRLSGARSILWDARVSPDGEHAAAGTESGELLVWSLDRPSGPVQRLRGHRGHINTVDYDSGGRIVTAGADQTVRVWNLRTGGQVVLRGHTDEVYNAYFTRGGTRVVSSSADGTVRLWDPRGGDALVVLQSGDEPIYDLSVGRGDKIATLDGHEVVRIGRCEVCGSLGQVRALARSLRPRALNDAERRRFLAEAG
jgi:WD40 repeat protein/DNA-binding SARP family transcriptional activator